MFQTILHEHKKKSLIFSMHTVRVHKYAPEYHHTPTHDTIPFKLKTNLQFDPNKHIKDLCLMYIAYRTNVIHNVLILRTT